jgi:iron-sulfur cluster repair protein YtfE (RIC family)
MGHTSGVAIVRIGEKESRGGEGDVVDSLLACHERIRSFLAMAARVGEASAPAEQVIEACGRIGRYFREAMPLHVADEEESILPRLRGRAAAVDRALDTMQEQHGAHEAGLRELIGAADAVQQGPIAEAARARIAAAAAVLETGLTPHLELEEAIILPAVRQLLSARELADIALEIRGRRT